ncbi:uncharacterized protein LOC112681007 [Sipha flava]|uniref:Uncharacterized protein LOC112681007 n=1 Tax=Sipha flava TaxID=143950 RepID=A0A8B8F897_9HEMI|nr:uncharacterized protein LOC112681007 [Sipha flava]
MGRHYSSSGLWASLALTVAVAVAAPQTPTTMAVDPAVDDVVYDQRQNGTENVRISLSDLKVVLAPADGLFQIMSMAGAQLFNTEMANAATEHRPTAVECNGYKCNNRHRLAAKKNRFKLSSFIAPLLNNQAEQKISENGGVKNTNKNNN